MNQNGSQDDMSWKPQTDREWHSRLYANNMNQATDLSSGGEKKPSTFELSNPDTVGIFIQPSNWVSRNPDPGHVGFLIAEKGGTGNAIGYNYGRYTIEGEDDSPYSGKTPGRLLKESYPFRRLENGGGTYYEINTDEEGARKIHRRQLELENDAYDLKGNKYLRGENTLNRKQFSNGEWKIYDIDPRYNKTCITYTITVIQAAFPVDSLQYKVLESLKGNGKFNTPSLFNDWLYEYGEIYGITRKRTHY